MYKPTRHSYEKRMKNQRRKAKAGLLLATTLTAGMAVNPCPAVAGLASYLTGTGNVSVVQAAETLSISKENVTKINISEQTPEEVWGNMQINIVLDTPGTYLLEGSNYINESYIDTQITVPEGVEVNIILADGFSINNDDANYVWGCGYARSTLGVNPFVINGTANLYIDGNVAISGQSTQTNYSDKQYVRGLFAVSGKLHIKEVKEGAVVTLENDVFDRTKWESQLSLTPGMFDGSGTVIIEEGTFDSKEISHGVNLNTTNISLSTMGDDESEEKFTTSVRNFIINGGNYGIVEIYEAKQNSNDYLYQTNLLINNASLTKTVCNSDRNASIEYGSCADVKENETGTGYIITNTNHDYGAADYSWSADKSTCTASRICQKDKTHIETETATATSVITKQPTCITAGERTYKAEFKNEVFATQTQTEAIAKKGHKYASPTYSWSADKSTCTASRVCQNDKTHVETEKATVTPVITKRPTCTTAGERTYKAAFKNAAFATQTQTEAVAKKGHKYEAPTYSWSADKSTCTASRVCQNDKTHVETEKATVTSAVTTQPTYEKTGVRTYTAAFKNAAFSTQTQTETIAKRVKPQENTQAKTSIKKASVSGISNKNYNGKSQKQSIKVKLGKKTLKQGTDYSVSYKNNKNIGKATVTIKGKGKYEGSIKKTFQITVAKGKTYTAGNFKYKMTKASTNGKGTVTLAATKKSKSDSKFTSCKITDTVKIGGKTFKVTAIGDNAFKGYKKLKTITIESKNIKSVGKDAIKNIHKKATIKVPKDKVKAYKKLFDKKTGFTSKMKIKKA